MRNVTSQSPNCLPRRTSVRRSGRARTWLWSIWLILCSTTIAGAQAPEEIDREREYNVKAANLYGLGLHTEWPAEERAVKSFRIAVLGDDPFDGKLERVAEKKKTLHNLPMVIEHPRQIEQVRGARIVFIPANTDPAVLQSLIKQTRHQSTILVGETADFAQSGGDANLVLDGGKVRLELNLKSLERKKVRPTPQLLKIANVVQESDQVSQKGAQ